MGMYLRKCLKTNCFKIPTLRTELPGASLYRMLQKNVYLKQSFLTEAEVVRKRKVFSPVVTSPKPLIKGGCLHLLLVNSRLILLECGSDG